MRLLGLSGSLRSGSYHTFLLKAAAESAESLGSTLVIHDISDIPFYNSDLEGDQKPAPVIALNDAIAAADAVIYSTPEYNHSISGVLKNAIDWVSRPSFKSVMAKKPSTIYTASKNGIGGARAQIAMREILNSTLSVIFPAHDFLVPFAHEVFDENGAVLNAQVADRLNRHMASFIEWVGQRDRLVD